MLLDLDRSFDRPIFGSLYLDDSFNILCCGILFDLIKEVNFSVNPDLPILVLILSLPPHKISGSELIVWILTLFKISDNGDRGEASQEVTI